MTMTTLIPVLLYHSVNHQAIARDRQWTVSPREFVSHLDAIAASRRTPMTVTQIADAIRHAHPLPARPVAITFDDGFADNYDALAPVIGRGLVATLYVTTGEIGAPHRLSAREVAELAQMKSVEVGAHAVRHRRLDELTRREVMAEVRDSKTRLEQIAGRGVHSFAYPHGAYAAGVRRAVAAAGYRSAAAVKNALSHDRDDPLAIARWTVTAGTPAHRVAEILDGRRVARAWPHERLRTRAHRAARRSRRSLTRIVRRRG
jgi:peptidoglycan/xylan/chitin deacetylase (PgdA/CDA1 family)